MKLPKHFQIGPHTVRVVRMPLDENNGEFSYAALEVRVADGLSGSVAFEVYCHEMVEAICEIYELDLKHHQIQTLGSALAQALLTGK